MLAPDCFTSDNKMGGIGICAAAAAARKTEDLIRQTFKDEASMRFVGSFFEVAQIDLGGLGFCGALSAEAPGDETAKRQARDASIADAGSAGFQVVSEFFVK